MGHRDSLSQLILSWVWLPAFTVQIFRLKLDSSKRSTNNLLFFISIKKSLCNLKLIALFYFVQISRSRFPQLSAPCHNRAQITRKSKQEFTGLVNFTFFTLFPYFKQKGWYFFSPRIRFCTYKVRPSESTVALNSLGRPKQVLSSAHVKFDV